MRAADLKTAVGVSTLLAIAIAAPAGAQSKRAPSIRIYSENADVLSTSAYITPAIQLAENAYVFAVAMDLDGQIQVLHPDFPGISVKLIAHKPVRLPNFFAGFNQQSNGYYSTAGYYNTDPGRFDSRGVMIALASRAPFDLEKIEVNGDWDMSKIRQLMDYRSPQAAAQALATYLGAKGEPIGRDFTRFAGAQQYAGYDYGYGYNAYSACDAYYGYGFGLLRQAQVFRYLNYLNTRGVKYRIAAYDPCGLPVIVPTTGPGGIGVPVTRPPRQPSDTTVFPKSRAPNAGPRLLPGASTATPQSPAAIPGRAGLPQMGEVTVTAPARRRGEPQTVWQGYRPSPGVAVPQGRAPIEHTVTPRSEPAAASAPVRQYRPEPRVVTPPPSRAPEAPRASSPPPTVHSAPVSSPPPRAAAPTTRTEPAPAPPPGRH